MDYRHVPDLAQTERALTAFARRLPGVRVLGGRHADLNLAPAGDHHKGTALERTRRLLACDTAIYVGDDATDEDAFSVEPRSRLLSIRVGRARDSRAGYYLRNQHEIDDFLRALIALRGTTS